MGYKKVTIKEITINLNSKRKPLNNLQRKSLKIGEKMYPYFGANNIVDYIDQYAFNEKILCVAEDGGSWGFHEKCSYIVNEKCWVNNHAHVLVPKEDKVILEYLYYYLNHADLSANITGSTRGKLNKKSLENIKIPLPPKPIQIKIVNALNKAQELIDNRKTQIEKYDELLQSVFLDMFGDLRKNDKKWIDDKFDNVFIKITDGDHHTPKREASGIKLLSARNVKNGYIDYSRGVDYVGIDEYQRMYKRCPIEKFDILLSCSGTIGRVATVLSDEKFTLVRSVALLKPDLSKVNSRYVEFYIRTDYMQFKMKNSSRSSAQANLFTGPIKKLPIFLPPLQLQNQFAEIVEKVEKEKKKMGDSLVELENNFNSIMQRAFRGELF